MTPHLRIENLSVSFGKVSAIEEFSLSVNEGEMVAVLGPNGSGKTTLLNVISGFIKPTAGQISLGGQMMKAMAAHRAARLGMGRTFQEAQFAQGLTLRENLLLGLGWPRVGMDLNQVRSRLTDVLAELGLDKLDLDARHPSLGSGSLKLLEVARALASGPSLLLLDEPTAGLTRNELARLRDLLLHLNSEAGLTCVIVEHNRQFVLGVCPRVCLMDNGRKTAEGPTHNLLVQGSGSAGNG